MNESVTLKTKTVRAALRGAESTETMGQEDRSPERRAGPRGVTRGSPQLAWFGVPPAVSRTFRNPTRRG